MKKYFMLTLMLLLVASRCGAQLAPVKNVASPEIASLGLYGNIPVSHYSGTPDISIPLYEAKFGKYVLPLSVSYHLSTVKPDSQYGCLGMGWNLIAGGYITRSVNFFQDEKRNDAGQEGGYYYHASEMNGITNAGYKTLVELGFDTNHDLSADEFSFSFCGYSGNFYYNSEGGWTVISEDDIKVEFDADGDGFITNQNALLALRMDLSHWQNKSANNRFFNKFTLVTPDGCKYEFGGVNATEYSISYYNRDNSDLIATTWRLSKITTPENRTVEFTYQTDGLLCDIRYAPRKVTFSTEYNLGLLGNNWVSDGDSEVSEGLAGLTGFLIFPVSIKQIKTDNEIVTFNYQAESGYGYKFLHDGRVLYYETGNNDRFDIYNGGYFNATNQFFSLIGVQKSPDINVTRNLIAAKLRCNILNSISITSRYGGSSTLFEFSYCHNNRTKLQQLKRKGYDTRGEMSLQDYYFTYNTAQKMPSYFVYPKTDSWGYYVGSDIILSATPTYSMVYPSETYTKAETLSSIRYPTGGKAFFTYEQNRYSQYVSDNHHSLSNGSGYAGGLRVSSVRLTDADGQTISRTLYHYVKGVNSTVSSGILGERPSFCYKLKLDDNSEMRNSHLEINSQGGFWSTANNSSSPIVGYSTVIEEQQDKNGVTCGYIKYTFSNYDTDIYGNSHPDDSAYYHTYALNEVLSTTHAHTSRSCERGRLLEKAYYDKDGSHMVKKVNYRYANTGSQYLTTSYQRWIYFPYYSTYIYPMGWLARTYTYACLKATDTDTLYTPTGGTAYSTMSNFTYNSYKLPSSLRELTSKGGERVTTLLYPFDFSQYGWMTNAHILSPLVRKTVSEEGKSVSESYEYASHGGVPYISKGTQIYNGTATKTLFQVNVADTYGNPVEVEADGMRSVLFWGRKGQLFLGRIDNMSHAEAVQRGLYQSNYDTGSPDSWYGPEHGFGVLPDSCRMISYGYNGNNLLSSVMQPTGFTTYYKYDGFGRLREAYHYDDTSEGIVKRILDLYDYRYYNEEQTEEY